MRAANEKDPTCYVCGGAVRAVPLHVQMAASREMNVPVWLLSPGISAAHPAGLVRHSYCRPGTERWARCLSSRRAIDRKWAGRFGLKAGAR